MFAALLRRLLPSLLPAQPAHRSVPTASMRAEGERGMSESERAFFAASGYVVVKGLLGAEQLRELNSTIDAQLAALPTEPERRSHRYGKYGTDIGANSTLEWGRPLVDAVLHPRAVGVCREILSGAEWLHAHPDCPEERRREIRLDHDYLNVLEPPGEGGATPTTGQHGKNFDGVGTSRLHGGPQNYHVTCLIELNDVSAQQGGFLCLPGSHRLGYAFPDREEFPDWEVPPYTGAHPRSVSVSAGDAIFFTVRANICTSNCSPR